MKSSSRILRGQREEPMLQSWLCTSDDKTFVRQSGMRTDLQRSCTAVSCLQMNICQDGAGRLHDAPEAYLARFT
ncbi:hypothetical protein IAQ61_002863 [Plenodomus lingam]|uniref:uncharacterized protein n=1 Tax=Leptosphaeria maculans TaxID=5022 RepID=UPI00332ECCA1|nr:hypothetical protein IAQ61_002863 [Plenodomus lingam]